MRAAFDIRMYNAINAKDCHHCEHSCAHNDHSPKRPHEFKELPVALW